jgi:hypothetical protein
MYKFMQKNKKKMLAIFGVFLMIVFILPTTVGQNQGSDPVVGTVFGDVELRLSREQYARQQWQFLLRVPEPFMNDPMQPMLLVQRLGDIAVSEIQAQPELYALLLAEADYRNVRIGEDQVTDLINLFGTSNPSSPMREPIARDAIRNFLRVQRMFERVASVIKVSEPMSRNALAQVQEISANVVEVPALDFVASVPQPTQEEIQAHFERFKNVDPRASDFKENPLGFGYRYPNRVKLQYLAISYEDVRKSVLASRDDHRWNVDSYRYYMENPQQFPTTQASTQPTTRPFEEVAEEIKRRITDQETAQKMQRISDRIHAAMQGDYDTFVHATPAGEGQGSAPASTLGAPYNSFEYLQKLAEVIQKEFGVLPSIVQLSDAFHGEMELRGLSGIGLAYMQGRPDISFAEYAIGLAAPFADESEQERPELLMLYEPSRMLPDYEGNRYFFRLIDTEKAHSAGSLEEVATKVEQDVRLKAAYAMAQDAAKKIYESAKSSGSLQSAANEAGRKMVSTGQFRRSVEAVLEFPVGLSAESRTRFIEEAFSLLNVATAESPHPAKLVELPRAARVTVVELDQVTAPWTADQVSLYQYIAHQQLGYGPARRLLQEQWYSYDNVVARTQFEPSDEVAPSAPAKRPATPRPPMF